MGDHFYNSKIYPLFPAMNCSGLVGLLAFNETQLVSTVYSIIYALYCITVDYRLVPGLQ